MSEGRPEKPLFAFVQFETAFALGPPDGRYVIRGDGGLPSHVLVLGRVDGTELRPGRRRRRPKGADAEPAPTVLSLTRATLVDTEPFPSRAAAARWRTDLDLDAEVDRAIARLNGVLHAHRAAAADPSVREVARESAVVTRIGVGEGEQVAYGRWHEAVEVPIPQSRRERRRSAVLRPQERLAAILAGRDVALASEELALRARADFDNLRSREAALQLRAAYDAAVTELVPWASGRQLGPRLERLGPEREAVEAVAARALEGGLDREAEEEVERLLTLVESALRARVHDEMS